MIGTEIFRFLTLNGSAARQPELPEQEDWSRPRRVQMRREGRLALDGTLSSFSIRDQQDQILGRICFIPRQPGCERLSDLLSAIERCDRGFQGPVETCVAVVLDQARAYFRTEFGALCLPDGAGRYEVRLDARQAAEARGMGRAGMEDLAREVVTLAGQAKQEACAETSASSRLGSEAGVSRFLSAVIPVNGESDGVVLFGNRSINVRPVNRPGQLALSVVSQIISGRIPDGGLAADRGSDSDAAGIRRTVGHGTQRRKTTAGMPLIARPFVFLLRACSP
ncbi:hypothetical protein [Breoghania sp.]|uniref:hypothetical protein n=1 Tax=Breoghania sp. TaxID=2065378 RepID=UPI0026117AF8|nr:hypothetical protein [Breoghania sp.]MDJ0932642.1 hypothetical protein [Breoghania sp.]